MVERYDETLCTLYSDHRVDEITILNIESKNLASEDIEIVATHPQWHFGETMLYWQHKEGGRNVKAILKLWGEM